MNVFIVMDCFNIDKVSFIELSCTLNDYLLYENIMPKINMPHFRKLSILTYQMNIFYELKFSNPSNINCFIFLICENERVIRKVSTLKKEVEKYSSYMQL